MPTVMQVLVRWCLQHNIIVIAKSAQKGMRRNIANVHVEAGVDTSRLKYSDLSLQNA